MLTLLLCVSATRTGTPAISGKTFRFDQSSQQPSSIEGQLRCMVSGCGFIGVDADDLQNHYEDNHPSVIPAVG